ncbi:MAG: hypothetical protein WC803_04050 [Sphingomonas sp.]|jgi:hypothetical protein
MQRNIRVTTVAVLALLIGAPKLLRPTVAIAQSSPASVIVGEWTGKFGTSDWTFHFENEAGIWSVRYISSKGSMWHDLQNIVVSGNTISFDIVSSPQLKFNLSVDDSSESLSGNVEIPSGLGVPFSAVRKF